MDSKAGIITDYKVIISVVTSEMVTNEALRLGVTQWLTPRGELVRVFGAQLRAHKAALGALVSIEAGKIATTAGTPAVKSNAAKVAAAERRTDSDDDADVMFGHRRLGARDRRQVASWMRA